jgi:hypothetical protein
MQFTQALVLRPSVCSHTHLRTQVHHEHQLQAPNPQVWQPSLLQSPKSLIIAYEPSHLQIIALERAAWWHHRSPVGVKPSQYNVSVHLSCAHLPVQPAARVTHQRVALAEAISWQLWCHVVQCSISAGSGTRRGTGRHAAAKLLHRKRD